MDNLFGWIYELAGNMRVWLPSTDGSHKFIVEDADNEEVFSVDSDGDIGIGVADPDTKLEVLNAGNQLKLSFDGTDNAVFAVDTNGDLTVTTSGSNLKIPQATQIGDGGATNYVNVSAAGDVNFVGGGGLAYGNMYTNADIAVTATSATWIELDAVQAWTTGKVHNCSFADPEITVTNAGTYLISYDLTLSSSIANKHVETGIMIDSTATSGPAHGSAGVQTEGRSHVELLAIEKGAMGRAIIQLAAGKTISLAVRNTDPADPTVTAAHGNLIVVQIAGVSA